MKVSDIKWLLKASTKNDENWTGNLFILPDKAICTDGKRMHMVKQEFETKKNISIPGSMVRDAMKGKKANDWINISFDGDEVILGSIRMEMPPQVSAPDFHRVIPSESGNFVEDYKLTEFKSWEHIYNGMPAIKPIKNDYAYTCLSLNDNATVNYTDKKRNDISFTLKFDDEIEFPEIGLNPVFLLDMLSVFETLNGFLVKPNIYYRGALSPIEMQSDRYQAVLMPVRIKK